MLILQKSIIFLLYYIVVSQSVEGFEINESIQEKMISILNGTADARELAKACLEKYASL